MAKPVEYRLAIPGFGAWRIAWSVEGKQWVLAHNIRAHGEQWVRVGNYSIAETAAIAVAERRTGALVWDGLRYNIPANASELAGWGTDESEGVQTDAPPGFANSLSGASA